MANFHTGSSTEPLVDADVVNGTQIKTVEYQCHVLGGVELPWAEHGERVISRCSKQFVYGVILRNPQSVEEVRLNHHNPSITEPSVLTCARWAVGNRSKMPHEQRGHEGRRQSRKFAVLRVHSPCPSMILQGLFTRRWSGNIDECNRLLFVGFYAVGWRLIRPAHDAILRVVSAKRFEILCIPRIVQLLHVLLILASIIIHLTKC